MAAHHEPLPKGKGKQYGRERQVENTVGHQHHAQHNHQRREHHQWSVDKRCVAHLIALEADEDGEEDDLKQPCHGDDQGRAHLYEVALDKVAHHHDGDGEERYAYGP